MSRDGNIRDNSTIRSGRRNEDTNKYRENLKKIDWTKNKKDKEEKK